MWKIKYIEIHSHCRMLRVSVVVMLLAVVGLASTMPQLNIPANNNNIFRNFPVTGGGVQGEVSSLSIVEVTSDGVWSL